MSFEDYYRNEPVRIRFPNTPTTQPTYVSQLNDEMRDLWIKFCEDTLAVLKKRNNYSMAKIILLVVLVIVILVFLGLVAYLIYRKFKS